jgi:proteasome accessory factor C
MLPWVIGNQGATVDEVCSRFGYTSKQELAKDLGLVFVCGLPGYGPGDLMVAYLEDDEVIVDMADYFARPLRLNPAEGLSLLAAGMALEATGQAPAALRTAIEKLRNVLMPDVGESVVVDLPEPGLATMLRDAAGTGKVVHLEYTSLASGETTTRDVEPWGVFTTLGNWYLAAFCRRATDRRTFRLDRIRSAAPTGERFEPPPEATAPEVRYLPSEDDVRAQIRLLPQARWVVEYYPVTVLDESPSSLTIEFSASDPGVAARLLVRLGDSAELLAGAEVEAARDALRNRILRRYGASPSGSGD